VNAIMAGKLAYARSAAFGALAFAAAASPASVGLRLQPPGETAPRVFRRQLR